MESVLAWGLEAGGTDIRFASRIQQITEAKLCLQIGPRFPYQ